MSIKEDYMKLVTTPIKWDLWGENVFGLVNSAAIFKISLNDQLSFVVETYYPNRKIDDNLEDQSLEFVKMVCDESYRLWIKEDFMTLIYKNKG